MTLLAPLITSFLRDHMPRQRRYSPHSCETYAHSFRLLFTYAAKRLGQRPSQLHIEQLDAALANGSGAASQYTPTRPPKNVGASGSSLTHAPPELGVTWTELVPETPSAAIPALYLGVGDIGPSRKMTFEDLLGYERTMNADPIEIEYATGSYDVPGWSPACSLPRLNPISNRNSRLLPR